MKKRIVLLTGNELRHNFFRKFLGNSPHITIARAFCEEGGALKAAIDPNGEIYVFSIYCLEKCLK